MSKNTNQDYYSKRYSSYEVVDQYEKDSHYLLSLISPYLGKNIHTMLDVGSGVNPFSIRLKEKYKTDVHAMDLNDEAVKKLKNEHIHAIKWDIEKEWPFKDKSFDIVNAMQVIEHVVDPDHIMTEATRVLKNTGLLIITTPNLAAWFNRFLLLVGNQPFYTEVSTKDKTLGLSFTKRLTANRTPCGHLRLFTLSAMKDLLHLYHFMPVSIQGLKVSYFPKYIEPVDNIFSKIPSLASEYLIVAKKAK